MHIYMMVGNDIGYEGEIEMTSITFFILLMGHLKAINFPFVPNVK